MPGPTIDSDATFYSYLKSLKDMSLMSERDLDIPERVFDAPFCFLVYDVLLVASNVLNTFELSRISLRTSEAIASSIDLHSISVIKLPDIGYVLNELVSV